MRFFPYLELSNPRVLGVACVCVMETIPRLFDSFIYFLCLISFHSHNENRLRVVARLHLAFNK